MLFGERCSLCGGRLDSHRVCTECGLDNNKSEKHYHVNRSSCDGQPLTHVHGSRYYSGNTGGSPQTQARAAQSGGTAGQTEARRIFLTAEIRRAISGRRFRRVGVLYPGMVRLVLMWSFLTRGGRRDGFYSN